MSELDENLELDAQKLKSAICLHVPIEVTSYTLPRNMELYMHQVLDRFLDECHQEQLKEYLDFCLGEIITNGKKANTKRVYFKDKGLDINNPEDYEKGMETFKEDTMCNLDYYLELQKKAGLYVKLSLKFDIDNIVVEIKNNSILTQFEEDRINNKLDSVQQYDNMEDVFAKVLDTSEGAGLGIIIMVLMLQKIGLSKNNFKIYSTDKETITKIVLPCNNQVFEVLYDVSQHFVTMEKQLPIYSSELDEIDSIVNSNVIDRNKVLNCIRKNPSFALMAAKKASDNDNFSLDLYKTIESLSDLELKEIYSKNSVYFRIVEHSPILDYYYNHSYKVAVYCYNLAKNRKALNISEEIDAEYLFGLGLLSNMGQIMVNAMTEEQITLLEKIKTDEARDFFLSGINSGFLSLQYAKNSGFPSASSYQLAGWNYARLCPPDSAMIMSVLYLAEIMQLYVEKKVEFYQIDREILKQHNINDEIQLNYVIEKVKSVL